MLAILTLDNCTSMAKIKILLFRTTIKYFSTQYLPVINFECSKDIVEYNSSSDENWKWKHQIIVDLKSSKCSANIFQNKINIIQFITAIIIWLDLSHRFLLSIQFRWDDSNIFRMQLNLNWKICNILCNEMNACSHRTRWNKILTTNNKINPINFGKVEINVCMNKCVFSLRHEYFWRPINFFLKHMCAKQIIGDCENFAVI